MKILHCRLQDNTLSSPLLPVLVDLRSVNMDIFKALLLGLNCPNCGAPLPGLGAKKCIYCDTPIVEYNLRVWNFSRVEEV